MTNSPPGENEVEIAIKGAGMNFKDLMIVLGQIPYFHAFSIECSGIVRRLGSLVRNVVQGYLVCGLVKRGYVTRVRTRPELVARIPAEMDLVLGASKPIVLCTAYHALSDVAWLAQRESVLIHAAAGGVVEPCVILARMFGRRPLSRLGGRKKKALVQQTYGIDRSPVFSSRDPASLQMLMYVTQ